MGNKTKSLAAFTGAAAAVVFVDPTLTALMATVVGGSATVVAATFKGGAYVVRKLGDRHSNHNGESEALQLFVKEIPVSLSDVMFINEEVFADRVYFNYSRQIQQGNSGVL